MRRITLLLLLSAVFAAAAGRKQIESLIQEIQNLAASEPPLLSADTRIRLAEAAAKLVPSKARDVARDVRSLLLTLPDADTRGEFGVRLARVFLKIDPEEAERFVISMEPRKSSGTYRDTKAEALDIVTRFWIGRDDQRALKVLSEGIGAGAFRAQSVKEMMDRLRTGDPSAVPGLFAILLPAFPEDGATDRDCLFLLECAAEVAPVGSALALEAAKKTLRALDSKSFTEDPEIRFAGNYSVGGKSTRADGARDAILFQVAGFLAALSPETYAQYKDHFSRWNLGEVKLDQAAALAQPENLVSYLRHGDTPDDATLAEVMILTQSGNRLAELIQTPDPEPISAELERARAMEGSSGARAYALEGIAMRRDATPAQRAQIAAEAIEEAGKEPLLYAQLWVYEGLLPYFWERGNRDIAVKAGQAMANTLARFCKCENGSCGSLNHRSECLNAYEREANYLFNFNIDPTELGIADPSLRARILVLKLKER